MAEAKCRKARTRPSLRVRHFARHVGTSNRCGDIAIPPFMGTSGIRLALVVVLGTLEGVIDALLAADEENRS